MANRVTRERLQPSLLDRLMDNSPGTTTDAGGELMLSSDTVRDSVRRDLGWLLNTTCLACVLPAVLDHPLVARSVLNYGMPDLAGKTVSSIDMEALERALREVVTTYEPRLLKSTVKIRVIVDREQMSHNAVAFVIEAELWATPVPTRLLLRTVVDLETGSCEVAELNPRDGHAGVRGAG